MADNIPLNVAVDPKLIEEMLVRTILDTAIGKKLHEWAQKKVEELSRDWQNPIAKVMDEIVVDQMRNIVRIEYTELIKAKIKERITDEALTALVEKMWVSYLDKDRY